MLLSALPRLPQVRHQRLIVPHQGVRLPLPVAKGLLHGHPSLELRGAFDFAGEQQAAVQHRGGLALLDHPKAGGANLLRAGRGQLEGLPPGDGGPPVSASAVRSKLTGVMPRELTIPEITLTIEHFAEGAARAKQGGFDGMELAGTGGYLFNQFLGSLGGLVYGFKIGL